MVTAFAPDARRDAAAAEIAAGAGQWAKITLRETHGAFKAGSRSYGVPSSTGDGRYYLTNLRYCSCKDYERRGQGCKHQRAAALYVARVGTEGQRQEAALSAASTPTTWKPCTGRCGELLAPEWIGCKCDACRAKDRCVLDAHILDD